MLEQQKLKLASSLYKHAFPLYRLMYFNFKKKKDHSNMEMIAAIIRPGGVILDIGANIGFYSKFLSGTVGPTGKVYCFEPDATNFRHLKNELKQNSNVTLIQKAVAAESGTLTLYTSDLLNVDHRAYEPENYSGKYIVEKISIDDYVNSQFKVNFIKMDIQGFEPDALKGMKRTIAENPDLIILTEFWPHGLKSAGSSALEMFDLVKQLGLSIYKVSNGEAFLLTREEVSTMKVEYFTDIDVLLGSKNILHQISNRL